MKPLVLVLIAACGALSACSPPPRAAVSKPSPAPVATPAPPPPAKKAIMVCRNSQTGAKAECGAPNAVMVGMKTE